MRAMWSTDSVFSLSLKPYVGTPPNRRSVTSMQAITVGSVFVPNRQHDSEAAPGQPGAPQPRFEPVDQRPVGVVPLKPQTRLRQPRPKPPSVASSIRRLGLGDSPPRRALRARIAHRLQLALGDVSPDPAVAGVNPLFNLVA